MINKIYFDMDGVLADFDRGVRELAGFNRIDDSEESDELMWAAIRTVPHFYDRLELMPGAKEMFDYVYGKYGDRCEILTGIPKPRRGITTAGDDKIAWMHRALNPDIKVNVVYKEEKRQFSKDKSNILIDDLKRNIDEWTGDGGTGILHKNSQETLRIFKNIEDIELIKSIRENNGQAEWEELCEEYRGLINFHVNKRLEIIFEKDRRENMYDDLFQEGWKGFIGAVKKFDLEQSKGSTFKTYAGKYIEYAVKNGFTEQLDRLGMSHKPKYRQYVEALSINSLMENNPNFDIPDKPRTSDDSLYDEMIEPLIESGEICDRGGYNSVQRTLQLLETLRMMSDENHILTKAGLWKALGMYRKIIHHNSVKEESENTLKKALDEVLSEVNPLEYDEALEDRYLIKYEGYKENRLASNKSQSTNREGRAQDITNLYYQHPFSYDELDKLIELISYSNLITEEEKKSICNKLVKTASIYYKNPIMEIRNNKPNPRSVSLRYSGGRSNVADNLKLLQMAMNQMTQVRFTFNRYDEDGNLVPVSDSKHILSPYRLVVYHDEFYCIGLKMDYRKIWHYRVDLISDIEIIKDVEGRPVPVELIPGGIPAAISTQEWNPQKYMAEHLYMGYDEPNTVRVRIQKNGYTMLQHWFGNNYRKIKSKSDDTYDVVEIKTSPSMLVPWALQYGDTIEILDPEVRKQIRDRLKELSDKYEA